MKMFPGRFPAEIRAGLADENPALLFSLIELEAQLDKSKTVTGGNVRHPTNRPKAVRKMYDREASLRAAGML